MTDEERVEGTFLVTAADDDSAVLKDVETGQVHTLSSNPGVEVHDAVEGVVAPDPPLNVSYQLVELASRRQLSVEVSEESPTTQVRDIAAAQPTGEVTREPRAGTGEIHVLTVPEETTEQAVADVAEDEETTLSRAARLGVARVEIRSAPGVVSVRYMP
jgi:serine/threonine protein kinase HipA of HipAB toxin-antitoxin module